MELTKKERSLIKKIRDTKEDNEVCVFSVKYTPIGDTGHIQTISHGTLLPITGLRTPLVNLLKDIKTNYSDKGYTILAIYDDILETLNVYKMNSVKKNIPQVSKIKPPIPKKKRKYTIVDK